MSEEKKVELASCAECGGSQQVIVERSSVGFWATCLRCAVTGKGYSDSREAAVLNWNECQATRAREQLLRDLGIYPILRPIRSQAEYTHYQAVIEPMLGRELMPGSPEGDVFELCLALMEDYDRRAASAAQAAAQAVTLRSHPMPAKNSLDHLKEIKAREAEMPKMLILPTDDTLLKRAEARAETLREALVRIQCLASEGPDVLTWTEVIQQIREAVSAALQTTKYESGVFRITPIQRELLRRAGWREDQQDPIAFLLKDRGLQWSKITGDEPADGDIRENLIVLAQGSTFLGELTGRNKSIDPALTWQEQDVWFVDNNCYDDEPPTHFLKLPPVIEEE